ncbi:hypothetical protein SAMN04244576_06619, partial [Sinorhizobium meliloti]
DLTLFVWKGFIIVSANGIEGFCLAVAINSEAVVAARSVLIVHLN